MSGPIYGIDDTFLEHPKISAACCARVSYVRQNDRKSVHEDITLAGSLTSNGHYSPLEHPARAERGKFGNFNNWKQLRKFYPGEDGVTINDVLCTCHDDIYSADSCEKHK